MPRRSWNYLLLTMSAVFLMCFVLVSVVSAEYGYGDVYRLEEETGQWIIDHGGFWASIDRIEADDGFFSNMGANYSITGTAIIDFEDLSVEDTYATITTLSSMNESPGLPDNTCEYVSRNGIFSLKVTAIPFDDPNLVDMVWDAKNKWFSLMHKNTIAKWQFTYKVTNNSSKEMFVEEVKDNYGGQLAIESWSISFSTIVDDQSQGNVNLDTDNNYGFSWTNFKLEPGQTAEITLTLATRKNPSGKQQYNECKLYTLNSTGVLKYRYKCQPGKGKYSLTGKRIRVNVCDKPPVSISVEMSAPGVDWFIRKPGDYYVKAFDAVVKVKGRKKVEVAVTFDGFNNLESDNSQQIPVFYSLGDESNPGHWITPENLNNTELGLKASAVNDAAFSMWQRVVLGTQSVGTYQDTGVITFTLVNSQLAICE